MVVGLIVILNKTSFAAGEIASGSFGECDWVIDSNGVLTISPTSGNTGTLENAYIDSVYVVPWYTYRTQIKELKFTGTVYGNYNCSYLFCSCPNLRYVDCTNFNTDNVGNMSGIFYGSEINKFKFGDSFNFLTWGFGIISDGMWRKEETGIEYTASEIMRGYVDPLAGTYTKTKNISEGLEVTQSITYKVGITSSYTWSTTNSDIKQEGNGLYYTLPNTIDPTDHTIGGKIELIYNNAASKADGSMYNLKITINNMHIYNYTNTHGTDEKYFMLLWLPSCELENSICDESYAALIGANVNYDVTIQVVDNNGNVQQGTFIFSAYDLDVADLEGNYDSEFSEGIVFLEGMDLNRIQTARSTILVREGNRFRGTSGDGGTEASTVLAISNAANTKVRWTAGGSCGTTLIRLYSPTSVQIEKITNKGAALSGAGLKLYRGTELIDDWTTNGSTRSFWLNTGTYTLKEVSVPTGYNQASDYTIYVEADGTIKVNGNIASKVQMIDQAKSFNVTYSYTGTVPTTASTLPAQRTYEYGDTVTVANNATAPGYTFSGWSRTGSFSMPASNVSITGSFTANTNTPYKIEHYIEDINANTFSLKETENKTGTTDTTANATAKTYEGFTFDRTISGTLTSGNIAGDGSLVLKLYYRRNSYSVSYSYNITPEGATALPSTRTYEYGDSVIVAENASAPGYAFSGWDKENFTMPANNVQISGVFTPGTDTRYKIEHYLRDVNSTASTLVETEYKTATTDTTVTATPKSFEGFYYDSSLPGNKASGKVTGDGSLVLTLYYSRHVYEYSIEYYFDGVLDDFLTETQGTDEFGKEITRNPSYSREYNGQNYTLVSTNHRITISTEAENNVMRIYYELDELDDPNDKEKGGDGIPDKYQIVVYYEVENGSWNDNTSDKITDVITLYGGNEYSEDGQGEASVPQVGNKPINGYKAGNWNEEPKLVLEKTDNEKNYRYTYIKGTFQYRAEYYFDEVMDTTLTEEGSAEFGEEISKNPETKTTHNENNYILVSTEHTITINSNPDDNIIRIYYELDELKDNKEGEDSLRGGDGIPDKYQIVVTYCVENGLWDDNTKEIKIDVVTLFDTEENYLAEGEGELEVPEVGHSPNEGYKEGNWDNIPEGKVNKDSDGDVYTYKYVKDSFLYKVEYYFDDVKNETLTKIGEATLLGEEVSIEPENKMIYNNKNYILVSNEHKITISAKQNENIIKVYYELDESDEINNTETGGDGIPDKYQVVVYYEVENGKWNDGTSIKKTEIITLYKDEDYSEDGVGKANIPGVGDNPTEGYKEGAWEETPKTIIEKSDSGITYKYVFKKETAPEEKDNKDNNEEKENKEKKNKESNNGNSNNEKKTDNNSNKKSDTKDTKETEVKDSKEEAANPKTGDKLQKYIGYGTISLILLSIAIRIKRKYGRKIRKIQY